MIPSTKIPEFRNTAASTEDTLRIGPDASAAETQSLHDLAGQYGHADFYQQHGVLRQWNADTTATSDGHDGQAPPPEEDAGLSIFSDRSDFYAPEIPSPGEVPARRRLWPRLGRRAAKATIEAPDDASDNTDVTIIAAAAIEALDAMPVSQTRPSLREQVSNLVGSFKLKIGALRTGGSGNFTKFLERHPKATVAVGVVAVAGLVVSAYFKTKGIELGGQPHAADVIQPGGGAGSGIQFEVPDTDSSIGHSLPKEVTQTSGHKSTSYVPMEAGNSGNAYVPIEDTPDSGSGNKYIPAEGTPDSDGDRSFIPRESGSEVTPTERLNGPGDTISHHAEQHLIEKGIADPDWDQIRVETQRILDLNGLSWEDAEHMGLNAKFKV